MFVKKTSSIVNSFRNAIIISIKNREAISQATKFG